ncbi:MAG: hypothetical protein H6706_28085 [Myxococcales bacterium]|nr:hypothetical protein [Myxococcales bacterium]
MAEAVEEFIFVLAGQAMAPAVAPVEAPAEPAPVAAHPPPLPAAPPAPARRPVALPPPAPRRRTRPAVVPVAEGLTGYEAFEAALPATSRRFLALVRARGTVGVGAVMEELGLATTKAVGGITGAIGRWAPERGVALPYEILTIDGERAWRWLDGRPAEEAPVAEEAPAAPPPRPRPRLVKPTPPPAPAVPEVVEAPAPTLDDVYGQLSSMARKLVDAVREARSLTRQDAVNALGLSKASGLSPIVNEIRSLCDPLGLRFFQDTVDYRGVNVYEWAAPLPAAATAPGAPATDEADREFATDGVIRRRRKSS